MCGENGGGGREEGEGRREEGGGSREGGVRSEEGGGRREGGGQEITWTSLQMTLVRVRAIRHLPIFFSFLELPQLKLLTLHILFQ